MRGNARVQGRQRPNAGDGGAREFVLFAIGLLAINAVAKLSLLRSATLRTGLLPGDYLTWQITIALGIAGIIAFAGIARIQGLKASRWDWGTLLAYLIASFTSGLLLWNHQDLSFDGTWYHLHRLIHHGLLAEIRGIELGINPSPGLSYPMLADDHRAVLTQLLRGSSAYSGVGVNIGIYGAAIWFWQRHALFLPAKLRWILPALCPISLSQLPTYYSDGYIACFFNIAFLAIFNQAERACTTAQQDNPDGQSKTDSLERNLTTGIVLLTQSALVLAALKYSFPFLVAALSGPLVYAGLQAWKITRKPLEALAGFVRRKLIKAACLAWLGAAMLILANPYGNLLVNVLGQGHDPNFQPAYIRDWGQVTTTLVSEEAGNLPIPLRPLQRFYLTTVTVDQNHPDAAWKPISIAKQYARGSWGFGLFHPVLVWSTTLVSLSVFLRPTAWKPSTHAIHTALSGDGCPGTVASLEQLRLASFSLVFVIAGAMLNPLSSNQRFTPQLHTTTGTVVLITMAIVQCQLRYQISSNGDLRLMRLIQRILAFCIGILAFNAIAGVSLQTWRTLDVYRNFQAEVPTIQRELAEHGGQARIRIKAAQHSQDAAIKLMTNEIEAENINIIEPGDCRSFQWFPSDTTKRVSPRFEYCSE